MKTGCCAAYGLALVLLVTSASGISAGIIALSQGGAALLSSIGLGAGWGLGAVGVGTAIMLIMAGLSMRRPVRELPDFAAEWPREQIEPAPLLLDEWRAVDATWREV